MNLYDIVAPMTMAEAQTDYQKRRQRERDVDAGRPVKASPKNPQTDYAKKRAQDKKDMALGEDAWHAGNNAWSSENHEMVEGQLSVGDPVVVTAANEFEGKTGEVAEFSPSGKFVVVDLYNHGKHSMHLSDVEYNQYADEEDADEYGEYELDEEHEPSPVTGAIVRRIMMQRTDLLKQYGPELVGAAIDNVADYVGDVEEIGSSDVSGWVNQVERMLEENPPEAFDEQELDEFAPNADRGDDEVPDQILKLANRWWNATDDQPKITNVLRSLGWSIAQVESEDDAVQMQHDDGTTYFISADDFDPDVFEGSQDFNKVEPYEVCLAGKCVKTFDYYEDARRFHDNWKKKLYAQGEQAKADRITLNPVMKESATAPIIVPKRKAKEKQPAKFHIPYTADDYVPPAVALARDEEAKKKGVVETVWFPTVNVPKFPKSEVDNTKWVVTYKIPATGETKIVAVAGDTEEHARENLLARTPAAKIVSVKSKDMSEAIVASGPSKPLDDRAVRKLVWDTMKINADTGEQAIQRALSVLAKKPQSRMVQDLQDKFQSLADRLAQGVAEAGSPAQQAAIAIAKKEQGIDEVKQRLDAKCWKGKHKEGTKIKGGVRVNNCVPNESVEEALSKKDLVKQVVDKLNDPEFRKQPADPTKRWEKGDLFTGPGPDDPYYTKNFGHGYPAVGSNLSHNRDVEKSLKKKKGVAEDTDELAKLEKKYQSYVKSDLAPAQKEEVLRRIRREVEMLKAKQVKEFAPTPVPSDNDDLSTEAQKDGFRIGASSVDGMPLDQAFGYTHWDEKYKLAFSSGWVKGRQFKIKNAKNDGVDLVLQKNGSLARAQGVAEMDKSQPGAAGWNIDDYPLGAKGTTAKPTTVKNVVKSATKDLDAAFDQADKKKPKPVKESYWTRLQNERSTKLNSLVNELKESIKK